MFPFFRFCSQHTAAQVQKTSKTNLVLFVGQVGAQVNGLTVRQQHRAPQAAAKPLDSDIRWLHARLLCTVSAVSPLLYWWPRVRYSHRNKAAALTHRGAPIILSCAALTNDERVHGDVHTCHGGSRQSARRWRRAPSELRLRAREKCSRWHPDASVLILILHTRSLPRPDHTSAHLLRLRRVKLHRDEISQMPA